MSGLTQVSLFLQVAVQMGTPILFGTLGGILCEKSGNINLGVEGMMLMGAVFGFMTALHTGNPFLTIAVAGLAGAFGALIYAVITVTLRGNHTVTGLALTIFGTG
ncbi:MAG: ABC transporter permease subunit, partial [Anaerotruncus colihominis]